ncbi:hypothetical protein MMC12_005301 [Toensbergia leucococca]|nr:hypothetical protein [Toensbergia leucococca]
MDCPTESANQQLNRNQRKESFSQASQTASEFIDTQLQLEADAREALPYAFDHCTYPLGPLRQNLFSCLTCNPPPELPSQPYTPAAVCYSCSIACHGEHVLVELFNRRNFTCDCGTTRMPSDAPCTLRIDPSTGIKGPVHSQTAAENNSYNQNFRNRFCGCGQVYDAHQEKGTMYQCLGLTTETDGGCGEDWWHPECVVGPGREWQKKMKTEKVAEDITIDGDQDDSTEAILPLPPGFPNEDDFDAFICYKCVGANSWIKRYADSPGFLPPVYHDRTASDSIDTRTANQDKETNANQSEESIPPLRTTSENSIIPSAISRKRRASGSDSELSDHTTTKKLKAEDFPTCNYVSLLSSSPRPFSLFLQENFRAHFCRCPNCYPALSKYPQLLEEEEAYEPPLSSDDDEGGESVGTASLLERGEAALSNVDRVRAIEGVMVYNHLKDKVKTFLQPFAESGQAVGAEDIKAYFEKLRGDAEAVREAGGRAAVVGGEGGEGEGDHRREQSAMRKTVVGWDDEGLEGLDMNQRRQKLKYKVHTKDRLDFPAD